MIWLAILALASGAFVLAAFALRLPRSGYTLLGAALLFGLAGYALQGSPGLSAAPAAGETRQPGGADELLVEARRELFDTAMLPSRFLITSDAFARRGDYDGAVGFARSAVAENPRDSEAWTALANALVEHAGGTLTPAAIYAYGEADRQARGSPAPAYFLGLALLRNGEPDRTREIWAELLASAPANAEWRPLIFQRLRQLDEMLARSQ